MTWTCPISLSVQGSPVNIRRTRYGSEFLICSEIQPQPCEEFFPASLTAQSGRRPSFGPPLFPEVQKPQVVISLLDYRPACRGLRQAISSHPRPGQAPGLMTSRSTGGRARPQGQPGSRRLGHRVHAVQHLRTPVQRRRSAGYFRVGDPRAPLAHVHVWPDGGPITRHSGQACIQPTAAVRENTQPGPLTL